MVLQKAQIFYTHSALRFKPIFKSACWRASKRKARKRFAGAPGQLGHWPLGHWPSRRWPSRRWRHELRTDTLGAFPSVRQVFRSMFGVQSLTFDIRSNIGAECQVPRVCGCIREPQPRADVRDRKCSTAALGCDPSSYSPPFKAPKERQFHEITSLSRGRLCYMRQTQPRAAVLHETDTAEGGCATPLKTALKGQMRRVCLYGVQKAKAQKDTA